MKKANFFGLCLVVAGLFVIKATLGDDLLVSGESASNGLNVVVSAPEGFADRVEIYTCSNLVSGNWRVAAENLRPSSSNPAKWHTEGEDVGFFVAGNMDVDSDGDGLPDAREQFVLKTDPLNPDTDGDGLSDRGEINSYDTNPLNADTDFDGMPDLWEVLQGLNPLVNDAESHWDTDSLTNLQEYQNGTNPRNGDTDFDGMPDGWEIASGFNPLNSADAAEDADNDGLMNLKEYQNRTDPNNPDTDGDGLSDGDEIQIHHTNPKNGDTDLDGMPDGWEVQQGLNPLSEDDALFDPDGDGFYNLEAYQASPDLSVPDTDGDGFIDSYDLRVNEFDYPVVGEGVFNMVSSWYHDGYAYAIGFNGEGAQLLTLRWSDSFWYPADYGNRGRVFFAGSSKLHWSNEMWDTMMESYVTDYWYWLGLMDWETPLPLTLCYYTLNPWEMSPIDQEVAEYVSANPDLINIPAGGDRGYVRVLATKTDDSQTSYLCAVLTAEYSEPAEPIRVTNNSGKMCAVDYYADSCSGIDNHGLPVSARTCFKFVFNQPVTNKTIKWITYNYDFDLGCQVNFAVHQCVVTGKESELFSLSGPDMIAPTVDLNGDFDLDGDVDGDDTILRAPANASLLIVPSGQTNVTPGNGIVSVKVDANIFRSVAPESVLRVKFSGVEPGEHFRLWSTIDVILELRFPVMNAVGGGGGREEMIEDPPLLIDTGEGLEHEWPVKNISPFAEGADYVSMYRYTPDFPKTLYLECVSCSASNDGKAKVELVYEYNGEEICAAALPITVIRSRLVPDWNHDRTIDMADQNQDMNGAPFRFWINDDHDTGDISEDDSDVPGQGGGWFGFEAANYKDDVVNGRSDLLDFFPLWLDINLALKRYPITDGTVYKLRQADDALKFVYTDLTRDTAGDFLIAETNTYGVATNQNAYEADTVRITSEGVELASSFLNRIAANTNKGVLMMEAVNPSIAPLVLEIWQNGSKVWETHLALSLSGVEDMYRWINVRDVAGGSVDRATDTREPSNNPDVLSNGKNFVFVHGYSVSEDAARAWDSEIFKRLYQSGSRAMFTAVAWYGNDSQLWGWIPFVGGSTPDYYANVGHAFETASNLVSIINTSIPGSKYIAGHSLGNMVVSSAIKDYGLSVNTYFMLNAAVAMEAYDTSFDNRTVMRHPDWQNYTNYHLWASEWHQLFPTNDGRSKLTWRGKFSTMSNEVNYYSSAEDVLNNANGSVPAIGTERAWVNQEMRKGTTLMWIAPGNAEAGWGLNDNYKNLTLAEANALPDSAVQTNAFFAHFDDEDLYATNGNAIAQQPAMYRQLLSGAIPALSNPAGRNSIDSAAGQGNRDFMTHNGGTGFRRGRWENGDWPEQDNLWHHSDLTRIAYPYNSKAFDQIVNDGSLK